MTVPRRSAEHHQATDAGTPVLETEPADEQGEQWHGAHSNMRDTREPRRQPGGVQRTVSTDDVADRSAT